MWQTLFKSEEPRVFELSREESVLSEGKRGEGWGEGHADRVYPEGTAGGRRQRGTQHDQGIEEHKGGGGWRLHKRPESRNGQVLRSSVAVMDLGLHPKAGMKSF